MIFDSPLLLVAAPVIAALVGLLAMLARRRRIQLALRWSLALGRQARTSGRWNPVWLGLAALALAVALAGPRGGRATVTTEVQSLNLVLAMDISRSMLAEDVAPSRLTRSIREARRLVHDIPGDRVGLIAFAGRSYILSPLTIDGGAITLQLDALSPDIASQGGTSLASVLRQGAELLTATTEIADRVLVLFTDGETHDSLGTVLENAARLKEQNVRLIIVANGTAEGARIPVRDSAGNLLEYQRASDGEIIVTRRNQQALQQIAAAADGTIIPAELADQAGAIRDLTAAFKRNPTAETQTADLLPLSWIPLAIAALILLVHTLTRGSAALAVLVLTFAGAATARAQRLSGAEAKVVQGDSAQAADLFLAQARSGVSPDTNFYNAGTLALAGGQLEQADAPLQRAAESLDPEIRFRALYNLGVAALRASRTDTARADALLQVAAQQLKSALLLKPESQEAKWNLELALKQEPPSEGGGGGQPPPPPSGQQDQPDEADQQPQPGGLTRSQAEQILNSVEREERATKSNQLKRQKGRSAGGIRDW